MSQFTEIGVHKVERHLSSRLLYPNPVCVLSTVKDDGATPNFMVISWVTPIDNLGRFFMSMNKKRASAGYLLGRDGPRIFGLSVACEGMEDVLSNSIGRTSGRDTDKKAKFNIQTCSAGWNEVDIFEAKALPKRQGTSAKERRRETTACAHRSLEFLKQAPAHILARVTHVRSEEDQGQDEDGDHDHHHVYCEILQAYVRNAYWKKNVFRHLPGNPKLLTFYGSRTFGTMEPHGDIVCSSARLRFCRPEKSRDSAVLALYNDRQTMLPHLAILCPLSEEAMASRRKRHREEASKQTSMFMDVVERSTGALIGTSGFRTIDSKASTAEWGIVVAKPWQRKGICQESFEANVEYATSRLKIKTITAATLPDNIPMRTFLEKVGMEPNGTHTDATGHEWLEFKLDLGKEEV